MNKTKSTYIILCILGQLFHFSSCASPSTDKDSDSSYHSLVIPKVCLDTSKCFIYDSTLFTENWDSLPQVLFWKKVMVLSPDSSIINNAATRDIICQVDGKCYFTLKDDEKKSFKDSLLSDRLMDSNTRLYVTTGKNHFYNFDMVAPTIAKAIPIFEQEKVDPWFAQAILLIECPGQLKKSSVGAYGNFQIMPKVARKFGLVVNSHQDDRKDLEKSAYAASRLIKEICIPYAEEILITHNINYNQNDLFFKLLVLHIYHAGAYNVMQAVNKLNPESGGMPFIQGLWQTETGRFKNASQNYSQVALAAMVLFLEKHNQQ